MVYFGLTIRPAATLFRSHEKGATGLLRRPPFSGTGIKPARGKLVVVDLDVDGAGVDAVERGRADDDRATNREILAREPELVSRTLAAPTGVSVSEPPFEPLSVEAFLMMLTVWPCVPCTV
jgi:hypothetical protein